MVATEASSSPLLGDDQLSAFARLVDEPPRSRLSAVLDSGVTTAMVVVFAPLLVLLAIGARLLAWMTGASRR